MMIPKLIVVDGAIVGQEYPLLGESITIGRASDNTISFPAELRVSAHHARILARIGLFWLEDLGSANGTYLQPPESGRFRLQPDESLLLVEGARIHLAKVVTLEARGLIASQDEATRQALARLQAFVGACYEQSANLPKEEREALQERLRQFQDAVRQAASETDLVRIVAERLIDLSRTILCAPDESLPPFPDKLPDPDSPLRLPSLHNLFLSRLQQLSGTEGKKPS